MPLEITRSSKKSTEAITLTQLMLVDWNGKLFKLGYHAPSFNRVLTIVEMERMIKAGKRFEIALMQPDKVLIKINKNNYVEVDANPAELTMPMILMLDRIGVDTTGFEDYMHKLDAWNDRFVIVQGQKFMVTSVDVNVRPSMVPLDIGFGPHSRFAPEPPEVEIRAVGST